MEIIKQGVILKVTEEDMKILDKAYDILHDLMDFGQDYEDQTKENFDYLEVDINDLGNSCDTLETVYRKFRNNSLSIVVK